MDAAIANNDWFEVGELLKQELVDGKCTTDILKLNRHIHYIDPEILALHYMCSQLNQTDREKVGNALSKLVEVNPQAKDILEATNLYYQVTKGNEEAETQSRNLTLTTTSTAARFICYLALIDASLTRQAEEQVLTFIKSLLGVYRKNRMQWMDKLISKYITPVFILCLRLPYLDLSIFSDVTHFLDGEAGKIYAQLKDINQFSQAKQLSVKLSNGTEIVATSDTITHHARVAKLQTHLLMLPQQQRINIPYADLMKILSFNNEEDLEQIFIQLTLLGVIDSQVDTLEKTITVTHVKALSGSKEIRQILVQRLEEWICKVTACKELFASIVENEQDE